MHKYLLTQAEIKEFNWDTAPDELKCLQMKREDHYYYRNGNDLRHHNHACPTHGDKKET